MAQAPVQRRSSFVWLWIILGIVLVIALIWWLSDTGTTPVQPPANTATGMVSAPPSTASGTVDQYGAAAPGEANPNPTKTGGTAAPRTQSPPAMSDDTSASGT